MGKKKRQSADSNRVKQSNCKYMWCKRHLKLLYVQFNISKSYSDKSLKCHLKKKITFFAKFVQLLHKRQHFTKILGVFTDGKLNKPTQDSHHPSMLIWPCPASLRFYHYKWTSSNHISPTLKQFFRLNCWRKKNKKLLLPFISPVVVLANYPLKIWEHPAVCSGLPSMFMDLCFGWELFYSRYHKF